MTYKNKELSFIQPHECKQIHENETHILLRYTSDLMGKDWCAFAAIKKGFSKNDFEKIKQHCFENCRIFNHLEVGFGVPGLFIGNVISSPSTLRPQSELFKKYKEMDLLK